MAEEEEGAGFHLGQRVRSAREAQQLGTVRYVGPVEGYDGVWIGVDWDSGQSRHDGSVKGVRYFTASGEKSGSLVRPSNLSAGWSLLEALVSRYKISMSKDDAEDMYLMSVRQRKVAVELVGQSKVEEKQKKLNELRAASLVFAGVSSLGPPGEISSSAPNIEELDLTGNLISDWNFVTCLCEELPRLRAVDLSYNRIDIRPEMPRPPLNLRTVVLNYCSLSWEQVDMLSKSLPFVEELHLRHNNIRLLQTSGEAVEGFEELRVLNLEGNSLESWDEMMKLSSLRSLKTLNVSGNAITKVSYPENIKDQWPFLQLSCLLLGKNQLADWESVDALDKFPNLTEVRLSENPIADTSKGGAPRYVLVARLSKITVLNGSEVKPRERKDSEIRYVRHVLNTMTPGEDIRRSHPRFEQLKKQYDISEESVPQAGSQSSQNMAASLITITIKCVAASLGEIAPVTRKLPGSMTVGKLKLLCEALFKLKATKQRLFLEEKESPLPLPLDDDLESLGNIGFGQQGVILMEEC
ncbi:tubulin-folding cofactor E [Selaginella moellendorffii]|uniref:tubulin-folding cofactor E n=1 Tax=Selaginella moellendorffii TaxID=88036 RepID=UPI000D1CB6EA|nr:tubulin-folding cofactor E [Selaginella moellendorffii]XP_024534251.1 tubulin-folding cofactor E [Selaginella moellendorffii]|eukprot:XP_024534249.1 tubulin-folding cofactor E [Selaginella moellendorffii]